MQPPAVLCAARDRCDPFNARVEVVSMISGNAFTVVEIASSVNQTADVPAVEHSRQIPSGVYPVLTSIKTGDSDIGEIVGKCLLSVAFLVLFTMARVSAEPSSISRLAEPAVPDGTVSPATTASPDHNSIAPSGNLATGAKPAYADNPVLLRNSVQQNVPDKPFTLTGAVEYAGQNYPAILKNRAEMLAAKQNVTVQKLNEYLPDSLFQYQEIMASHNKLSEVFYGSPAFPAVSGPGFNDVNMAPVFYSGAGLSIDWAPLDFGLHKARINLVKSQYAQATAQLDVTALDVSVAAANAFLDVVEALEQVRAADENVASFGQFHMVVEAQVNANLKPGADASLAEAQLANATNQLLRARLLKELALANLANTMGIGGKEVAVDAIGIASELEPARFQQAPPIFEMVPILKASRAAVASALAQRKVLDKEYFPVFHFLGGFQTRSSGSCVERAGPPIARRCRSIPRHP